MKQCIFCKESLSAAGRAKEHILPAWLQSEWGLTGAIYAPTHFSDKGAILSSRKHNLGSLLAGQVCENCNCGWMANLETRCKPLILELAGGKRRIIDLSDPEALLLARWTVKTAFVLHASSNYRMIVKPDHFKVLDQDEYRLPDNTVVVGHTYSRGKDFTWIQTTSAHIHLRGIKIAPQELEIFKESAYKIALKLGGLYLMVFHNPFPNMRTCLWQYRHIPLYPRWSHPVAWQKADKSWPSDPKKRFAAFIISLGVCKDSSEQSVPEYAAQGASSSEP